LTKQIILITGTPCIGKTSTAKLLTTKLNALYINLTELATKENLILNKDKKRNTLIIDETIMKQKIHEKIENSTKENIIIDGHYAPNVVPEKQVTYVFVLRRDPAELRKLMQNRGYSNSKLWENLASEILDVCLVDALSVYEKEKVCELNVSGKEAQEITDEILSVLSDTKKCRVGIVDWLGKLEKEGILDEYLRI
jgi:adenylate kinase